MKKHKGLKLGAVAVLFLCGVYRRNFPTVFEEHIIEGGCHAGFGSYGSQDGNGVPTITGEEQIAETARLLTAFFDSAQE